MIEALLPQTLQAIPLHLPPGDLSQERTVQIDGTSEQIEAAKLIVDEVISEVCPMVALSCVLIICSRALLILPSNRVELLEPMRSLHALIKSCCVTFFL